jgi:enoyl-CoA hydratase
MSPLAVRLTFEQLRRGAGLGFDDALRLEYRIVQRVLEHGDFHEGVRALLIDKDKAPRWRHASIEAVPDDEIERFMAPLSDPAEELVFDWHRD